MHTLVLLPGLACDAELWRGQLPALATRHRVHVSDVQTRCDTLPAMAATLLAENPGPLVLAGASMGGMLALEVHRQAPERVRGLALLGTSARADTPELLKLRSDAHRAVRARPHGRGAGGQRDVRLPPRAPARPCAGRRLSGDDPRAGAAQLIRQNRAVMARADSRPRLPQVGCPVLVACGEADLLTPPEHAREMAAALPRARLELLPAAGHMLTMEQPARVATLLAAWLQDLGSGR